MTLPFTNPYRGFANYATWRVYIEYIDDEGQSLQSIGATFSDQQSLVEYIKRDVDDLINNEAKPFDTLNSMVLGYARAFVESVDFVELAERLIKQYPSLVPTKGAKALGRA